MNILIGIVIICIGGGALYEIMQIEGVQIFSALASGMVVGEGFGWVFRKM